MSDLPDPIKYAGMPECDVSAMAKSDGWWTVRVIMRDGVPFVVTDDYHMDRLNLAVRGALVVEATRG